MPFIKIQWIKGRTEQQKKELSKRITDAFIDVTQVTRDHVWIVFEDVERVDWAIGGVHFDEQK
jgi:4-oxalocrotonate tautomerase